MKKLFTKIAIAIAGFTGVAVAQQDPQFTQFYANPLYLAPSFAGATKQHRAAGSFRDQWPGFP